jgi:SAM-dependent methyltransferase
MICNDELCCPCNQKCNLINKAGRFFCSSLSCEYSIQKSGFPLFNETPVLISFTATDTVCDATLYQSSDPNNNVAYIDRSRFHFLYYLKKKLASNNRHLDMVLQLLTAHLKENVSTKKLLIVGAGDGAFGFESILDFKNVEIVGIDIYSGQLVDFIADAHYLPFKSDTFDAIIIQAVLEHVIDPNIVVAEIYRVLKTSGLVYSESSFMQQVHEGAYDFFRFTPVGHRYLFRNFETLLCGGSGSSGIVLAWSFRYFFWALTRSKRFASLLSTPFFLLLPFFDKFLCNKSLFDSSSSSYFLGRKSLHTITHRKAISEYKGMQY